MKLMVNGLLAVVNEGIAEALVTAERAGIDREQAYDVIASSAAGSPYAWYKRAHFLEPGEHPVTFTPGQMHHDVNRALDLAREMNVPAILVSAANQMLTAARGFGHAEEDLVAVADVLRALSAAEERAAW